MASTNDSQALPIVPIWHAAFPTPSFDSRRISATELAELITKQICGVDYIVIDVRRTDFEEAFIKGALNLPAHSFYPTIFTIITLLSPIPKVIFHCNSCSPTGRGPRAAGWYSEELKRRGIGTSEALVLDGGVKGWIAQFGSDSELVVTLPKTK